jgi:hypothetical protein
MADSVPASPFLGMTIGILNDGTNPIELRKVEVNNRRECTWEAKEKITLPVGEGKGFALRTAADSKNFKDLASVGAFDTFGGMVVNAIRDILLVIPCNVGRVINVTVTTANGTIPVTLNYPG